MRKDNSVKVTTRWCHWSTGSDKLIGHKAHNNDVNDLIDKLIAVFHVLAHFHHHISCENRNKNIEDKLKVASLTPYRDNTIAIKCILISHAMFSAGKIQATSHELVPNSIICCGSTRLLRGRLTIWPPSFEQKTGQLQELPNSDVKRSFARAVRNGNAFKIIKALSAESRTADGAE
jgi:hypothetical protein